MRESFILCEILYYIWHHANLWQYENPLWQYEIHKSMNLWQKRYYANLWYFAIKSMTLCKSFDIMQIYNSTLILNILCKWTSYCTSILGHMYVLYLLFMYYPWQYTNLLILCKSMTYIMRIRNIIIMRIDNIIIVPGWSACSHGCPSG